ncbi:M50 family metallopeptidase [Bythopirellula polymerisocia]|uniref:Peptidase family M50 n=1 Tax=Bythopirellula polymerisocia TaxID=2528003 RepID=A0A5C6D2A7_9BACT|nr:M50 family metallopeptidase [Bythopirellula polymerisocia]TWU29346.1 hypothetical protein Pla144_01220 [Bythopirellula polymerisocia]
MSKIHECLFLFSFLSICWFSMQAVHEFGHIAGAITTGGKVELVVLHPLTISRTDLAKNPHPLIVAWAGPILGSIVPLLFFAVVNRRGILARPMSNFFQGFCLISNGLYIGLGSLGRIGDAGDLLRLGAPPATLWLFGITASIGGLLFWHRLGPGMGWTAISAQVTPKTSYLLAGSLLAILLFMVLFGGRN